MLELLQQLTITEERIITISERETLFIIRVSTELFWVEKVSTDSVAIRGTGGRYTSLVELAKVYDGRSVYLD